MYGEVSLILPDERAEPMTAPEDYDREDVPADSTPQNLTVPEQHDPDVDQYEEDDTKPGDQNDITL